MGQSLSLASAQVQMGWWDWFGVIAGGIGLVAFIMAAPTFLQMYWGRAKVQVEFVKEERALIVLLKNPPLESKLLHSLGVKRETVQSLTASFRISEAGSGSIVVPVHHAVLFSDDASPLDPNPRGAGRVALPPTYSVATSFVLVAWDESKNQAVIPPDRLRGERPLAAGQYRAAIMLIADGRPDQIVKQFVIGQDSQSLMWLS